MGIDFLRRSAPSFHRALDRRAVELRTPTLFTSDISCVERAASADIRNEARLQVGEKLLLRLLNGTLIAQRENLIVAEFSNPPAEFIHRVQIGACIEEGQVRAVHPLSGVVEIGFCE